MDDIDIGPARPRDALPWRAMMDGYVASYGATPAPGQADAVWGRLTDPAEPSRLLIARHDAHAVGFAVYVDLPHVLTGRRAGYLDDLYVDPAHRGRGIGRALVRAVAQEGRRRGWANLRWLADAGNASAVRLYDALARRTEWCVYQLDPARDRTMPEGG